MSKDHPGVIRKRKITIGGIRCTLGHGEWLHRNGTCVAVLQPGTSDEPGAWMYEGIHVVIIKTPDQKWWITPQSTYNEDKLEDVGPYDTMKTAFVAARLSCTIEKEED